MLSREEVKSIYDRVGKLQDTQKFYEERALRDLVEHSGFADARAVIEFGCGTGSFAQQVLQHDLPPDARYVGVDISSTMVSLAKKRLSPLGKRAEVHQTDGSFLPSLPDGQFDRFISNYVLDLLPTEDAAAVVREAFRVLVPGGRICLVSLTHGTTPLSRFVSSTWTALQRRAPKLVGGCRPVELGELVDNHQWSVLHLARVTAFGVPSEILVAKKCI
jgi:ubiquinone/menaquinone biosynthesis C-methylase UbiE